MIARIEGTLVHRELERVEILTGGGVAYECLIPLSVYETLPANGQKLMLHTHLVVREDTWQLYGFRLAHERAVFQKLLGAKGVGPALALGILSALTAERVVRALREKDVVTLTRVPRVGRKKAEQIILDLADKMDTLAIADDAQTGDNSAPQSATHDSAVRALMALGFNQPEAARAVRAILDDDNTNTPMEVSAVVRRALASLTSR